VACPLSRRFSTYGREAAAYVQASAKGRRGRLLAAYKLPVTKRNLGGRFNSGKRRANMTDTKRSLFLKHCKTCKKDVAWSVKSCPHCGVKNPTVGWKQNLAAFILVMVAVGLFLPDSKKEEKPEAQIEQPTTPAEINPPAARVEAQPIDYEKLRAAYDLAQEKYIAAADFWAATEKYVSGLEGIGSIPVTENLIQGMQASEDAAQAALFEQIPATDEETKAAFSEMNSGISGMFGNTSKRIKYAIEVSSGTDNPVKSMERFVKAKQMYEYNVEEFLRGSDKAKQILDHLQENNTGNP
jgi:hypothetical protein